MHFMVKRVTLITGASSGIGAELARIFALSGYNTVLVARRDDRLKLLADEIAAAGHPRPDIIACDLNEPDACERIVASLKAMNVEVETVVNNAGYGLFGEAADLDRAQQLAMVNLNVCVLTDLTLRFAESLIPPSRRHSQRCLDRVVPARPAHGGLLRHQGLRPVFHGGDARRARTEGRPGHGIVSGNRCRPNFRVWPASSRVWIPQF